jgi:hypothetical protein
MSHCTLCETSITINNKAIFNCGHVFHLSCVLHSPFSSLCSTCDPPKHLLPDFGIDRSIAMAADLHSKIEQRRLKDSKPMGFIENISRMISPLTPQARTLRDNIKHNKKLSIIHEHGFGPDDAVRERIYWSEIHNRYNGKDILDFGFHWNHMVDMGILPTHINAFTWTQQKHQLELNAQKLLQMRITITELANLKYTTHQLVDLGFTWSVLTQLGANVATWKQFQFTIDDIKRYWSPTLSQWVSAGFYDKERVKQAGWPIDDILDFLPVMTERAKGRSLRLAF